MKISVVTPVYNREDCILKCLESVASENAGGRRIEHVIADDGSTDRSASIVASFAASHPDVKLVRLDKNSGPNAARNAAIAAATGDYVLFIDSDDCLVSGSIEKIEAIMNSDPVMINIFFRVAITGRMYRPMVTDTYSHIPIFCLEKFSSISPMS